MSSSTEGEEVSRQKRRKGKVSAQESGWSKSMAHIPTDPDSDETSEPIILARLTPKGRRQSSEWLLDDVPSSQGKDMHD
jgi:hypothetical protein